VDKVLIVDDSVMLINYLEEHLKRYEDRFSLVTAKDGMEAIEILKKEPVSLLVTDLQMPKVDGLVLLAYTHKYHPNIMCIVMSAHGTAEELARAIMSALSQGMPGGSLSGISIVNFLQMVEMEQKTCLCEVDSPDHPKGFFYFKGGVLHHAVCGNLKGEEAAMKMIQIENATISFRKPPERKIPRVIKTDLIALILEAMRLRDES
jgi:CheY-like chemotaxis protein